MPVITKTGELSVDQFEKIAGRRCDGDDSLSGEVHGGRGSPNDGPVRRLNQIGRIGPCGQNQETKP